MSLFDLDFSGSLTEPAAIVLILESSIFKIRPLSLISICTCKTICMIRLPNSRDEGSCVDRQALRAFREGPLSEMYVLLKTKAWLKTPSRGEIRWAAPLRAIKECWTL
jgi:hypothetical protein